MNLLILNISTDLWLTREIVITLYHIPMLVTYYLIKCVCLIIRVDHTHVTAIEYKDTYTYL